MKGGETLADANCDGALESSTHAPRSMNLAIPSAFSRTCAQRHAGAPIATGTGVGLPPASSVLSALQILSLSVVSCGVLEARDSLVTLEDAATYTQETQAVSVV